MKKLSTRVMLAMGKRTTQTPTIGLDLGDRSSYYCVLDETGRIVREARPPHNPLAARWSPSNPRFRASN